MQNIKIKIDPIRFMEVIPKGMGVNYEVEDGRLTLSTYKRNRHLERVVEREELIELFSSWCELNKHKENTLQDKDFTQFLESLFQSF